MLDPPGLVGWSKRLGLHLAILLPIKLEMGVLMEKVSVRESYGTSHLGALVGGMTIHATLVTIIVIRQERCHPLGNGLQSSGDVDDGGIGSKPFA